MNIIYLFLTIQKLRQFLSPQSKLIGEPCALGYDSPIPIN